MEVTLVRHGQAQFGHDNYDQLSELGQKQSFSLGNHFKEQNKSFDLVVTGSMLRHRETASNLMKGFAQEIKTKEYSGLNEYDFHELLIAFKKQQPEQFCTDSNPQRAYYKNITQALDLWMQDELEAESETWTEFVQRVMSSFQSICEQQAKKILVVSSGGPISVIIGHALSLNANSIRSMSLQIRNTSTSTLLYNRIDLTLDSFNGIGHLEQPSISGAVTIV
jgi:broad specificity phosphatase PhoE